MKAKSVLSLDLVRLFAIVFLAVFAYESTSNLLVLLPMLAVTIAYSAYVIASNPEELTEIIFLKNTRAA